MKVAVVTGAGSGIGRAASLALLQDGCRVVLAGRRLDALHETARAAGRASERALAVHTDVRDPASVRALFQRVKESCGRLDVLFNNAGLESPRVPLEDVTYEQWRAVVDVNLTGMFLCTQEAFRIMRDQSPRGGGIINNRSGSGTTPGPHPAPLPPPKNQRPGLRKTPGAGAGKHR